MRPVSDGGDAPSTTRSFTAKARRAQLVETALATIAELGYARTSLAEVAARAGVSKGVISYHFSGKDELVDEAAARVAGSLAAYVAPRLAAASSARDYVRRYLKAHVKYYGNHRDDMRAMAEIGADRRAGDAGPAPEPPAPAPSTATATDPAALAMALRDGQAIGELRTFDADIMAASMIGALKALLDRLAVKPAPDVGSYAAELTALFDAAIAPPPRSSKR